MFFSIDIQGYMCHRIIQQDWGREDEVECAARGDLMLASHLQMHTTLFTKRKMASRRSQGRAYIAPINGSWRTAVAVW